MSTGHNNGGPAFPVETSSTGDAESGGYGHQTGNTTWQFPGMSLRDYFAAKAMQSLIEGESQGEWDDDLTAQAAYRMADAMLKARQA